MYPDNICPHKFHFKEGSCLGRLNNNSNEKIIIDDVHDLPQADREKYIQFLDGYLKNNGSITHFYGYSDPGFRYSDQNTSLPILI